MSSYNSHQKYLDELYFHLLEYYNFENQFTSDLSKNSISTHIICLVDAEEIENWKEKTSYDSCIEFLENCDSINFNKYQLNNQNLQKNSQKFKLYQTLDEVCDSLKRGGRISIIGHDILCYLNKITYTKKCFKCYTKNNQLIIYFGQGKSIFIPKFIPNKILDSENVFIVDLQGDKNCFIEAIFDNNCRYQNMYESIKSCGNKAQNNLKMSMTNLLSYDINKDELKKFKNYNFYFNEEEKNNDNNIIGNQNINQQENNVNNNIYVEYNYNYDINNDNDKNINYNYDNNYYINYVDNGQNPIIEQNYSSNNNIYNEKDYNQENYIEVNYIDNNLNMNEYPRDSNENININNSYNNKYPNQNYISEEEENKENPGLNNNIEEPQPEQEKEENKEQNNIKEDESKNQIEQEKETFYLNDINNKEKEKEENKSTNKYIDTESQNQIDQEKDIFYINYLHNQKTNPELKDLSINNNSNEINISINEENNNINNNYEEKIFNIENIKKFPTLGLENTTGNNSYINVSIQCLANTIPLINVLLEGKNLAKIILNEEEISPKENPQLLPSFLKLLKKLWTNTNLDLKSLNPDEFIKNLKLFKHFESEGENDAGSLITFILEQLYSEIQNNKELFNNNTISLLDTFFGGEKELTSECLICLNNKNSKPEEIKKFIETKDLYYLTFKLDNVMEYLKSYKIKENNCINIYDCLNFFENPNAVVLQNGKICEKCGNKDTFLLTSKITKLQNNLMISLNKNFKSDKKEDDIKYELDEVIDLKNYIKSGEIVEKNLYYLYCIICVDIKFVENKNIYHHIALCKSPVDTKWYKYDDTNVEHVNDLGNEVNKFGIPVALFYQKCEN